MTSGSKEGSRVLTDQAPMEVEAQCSPVSMEDVELEERTHEMSVQETEEEMNSNFDISFPIAGS